MPSERLAALDLSTKSTGWATWDEQTRDLNWSHVGFNMVPNHPGPLYLKFRSWLHLRFAKFRPTLIAIEQPHLRGVNSYYFTGMYAFVLEFCAIHGCNYCSYHSGRIKRHATGKGNATKEEMVQAALVRGWLTRCDDEADALWTLDLARHDLSRGYIPRLDQGS